jgi:hypothetical protein
VQMQSPALSAGLIGSDHTQTFALRQGGVIEITCAP